MTRDRNASNATPVAIRMQHYRARQRGENIPLRKPGPRPRKVVPMIPAHPGQERGYALDLGSFVCHAAAELEKAGVRGVTVIELAAGYQHTIAGDLARARLHHGLDSDLAARRFLMDRALSALRGYIRPARRTSAWRLAVPFSDLRYDGQEIPRMET